MEKKKAEDSCFVNQNIFTHCWNYALISVHVKLYRFESNVVIHMKESIWIQSIFYPVTYVSRRILYQPSRNNPPHRAFPGRFTFSSKGGIHFSIFVKKSVSKTFLFKGGYLYLNKLSGPGNSHGIWSLKRTKIHRANDLAKSLAKLLHFGFTWPNFKLTWPNFGHGPGFFRHWLGIW